MTFEFIGPEDNRWSAFLRGVKHDFYHLPEYVRMAGCYEQGEPTAFYAEADGEACLIPLVLRRLPANLEAPADWRDASSPYGYPSPLFTTNDEASVSAFLQKFKAAAAEAGIISVFCRLHPLLNLPLVALQSQGNLVRHGETVYIDLALSPEELMAATRQGHRYEIRKLAKNGFEARINDWSLFDTFIEIYHEGMRRLNATSFYMFTDEYFARLKESLGERLHLCTVMSPEAEVAACGLFTTFNGIVQYHLSATAEKYQRAAPAKMMVDYVRTWAKNRGEEVFHLGGGVGSGADSLFLFKAGFSSLRADFHTFRMVTDAEKYENLGELRRKCIKNVAAETESAFFPYYRKPI